MGAGAVALLAASFIAYYFFHDLSRSRWDEGRVALLEHVRAKPVVVWFNAASDSFLDVRSEINLRDTKVREAL